MTYNVYLKDTIFAENVRLGQAFLSIGSYCNDNDLSFDIKDIIIEDNKIIITLKLGYIFTIKEYGNNL